MFELMVVLGVFCCLFGLALNRSNPPTLWEVEQEKLKTVRAERKKAIAAKEAEAKAFVKEFFNE